jgi:hypothetical protein
MLGGLKSFPDISTCPSSCLLYSVLAMLDPLAIVLAAGKGTRITPNLLKILFCFVDVRCCDTFLKYATWRGSVRNGWGLLGAKPI